MREHVRPAIAFFRSWIVSNMPMRDREGFWARPWACGVSPAHIPGAGNPADLMTKVLPRRRIQYLMRRCFGLHLSSSHAALPNKKELAATILRHVRTCSSCDAVDVGYGAEVRSFLCLCRGVAQKQ